MVFFCVECFLLSVCGIDFQSFYKDNDKYVNVTEECWIVQKNIFFKSNFPKIGEKAMDQFLNYQYSCIRLEKGLIGERNFIVKMKHFFLNLIVQNESVKTEIMKLYLVAGTRRRTHTNKQMVTLFINIQIRKMRKNTKNKFY